MTNPRPGDATERRIASHSDLIAAIPAIIGFVPADSALVVGLDGRRITNLARTDLTKLDAFIHDLRCYRLLDQATTAEIIVVGPGDLSPVSAGEWLPHAAQVAELTATLAALDCTVTHAAWTAAVRADQRWYCYRDPLYCNGILPDPGSTLLAVDAVVNGQIIHPSRDAMAETLRPDPDADLNRRAALIAHLAEPSTDQDQRAALERVRQAILRAQAGFLPATDDDIAALAVALNNPMVRDLSLRLSVDQAHAGAQQLWTTLVRSTPAPHRAEPAVLLAVTAYLGGSGALAAIAAHAALDAKPGHALAELLLMALGVGLPPAGIRDAVLELPDRL